MDNFPGFLALRNDKLLESVGVKLGFGKEKDINNNSSIDKAIEELESVIKRLVPNGGPIQELESVIKRLVPNGGPISAGTLGIVICHINNRIRATGLSAKEIIMKRDGVTDEPLNFEDKELQLFRYEKRLQTHQHSKTSKARGKPPANNATISKGEV